MQYVRRDNTGTYVPVSIHQYYSSYSYYTWVVCRAHLVFFVFLGIFMFLFAFRGFVFFRGAPKILRTYVYPCISYLYSSRYCDSPWAVRRLLQPLALPLTPSPVDLLSISTPVCGRRLSRPAAQPLVVIYERRLTDEFAPPEAQLRCLRI